MHQGHSKTKHQINCTGRCWGFFFTSRLFCKSNTLCLELAVDETSIGSGCHPTSINTAVSSQFTRARMQLDSAHAQHPEGAQSLSLQGQLGSGLQPGHCLMQSEDFGDTEWISHPLLRESGAEVMVLCPAWFKPSPCIVCVTLDSTVDKRVFSAAQVSNHINDYYLCSCKCIVPLV